MVGNYGLRCVCGYMPHTVSTGRGEAGVFKNRENCFSGMSQVRGKNKKKTPAIQESYGRLKDRGAERPTDKGTLRLVCRRL